MAWQERDQMTLTKTGPRKNAQGGVTCGRPDHTRCCDAVARHRTRTECPPIGPDYEGACLDRQEDFRA